MLAFAWMLIALPALAAADPAVPEGFRPEGFRMDHYRAATPDSVPGAHTIMVEDAAGLMGEGAVAIDVTPLALGTYGAMRGKWIVKAEHESIPGAVWLPNIGLGAPGPKLEGWFRAQLTALTQGDPAKPVIFFCQRDCWMSWNAAKRAAQWGHRATYWLKDGIDGWRESLRDMAYPMPRPLNGS